MIMNVMRLNRASSSSNKIWICGGYSQVISFPKIAASVWTLEHVELGREKSYKGTKILEPY